MKKKKSIQNRRKKRQDSSGLTAVARSDSEKLKIFVSYKRTDPGATTERPDQGIARSIREILTQKEFGCDVEVIMDQDLIKQDNINSKTLELLVTKLLETDVMVAVASRAAEASVWVQREWAFAKARQTVESSLDPRVIAVKLMDYDLNDQRSWLSGCNSISCSESWEKPFRDAITEILSSHRERKEVLIRERVLNFDAFVRRCRCCFNGGELKKITLISRTAMGWNKDLLKGCFSGGGGRDVARNSTFLVMNPNSAAFGVDTLLNWRPSQSVVSGNANRPVGWTNRSENRAAAAMENYRVLAERRSNVRITDIHIPLSLFRFEFNRGKSPVIGVEIPMDRRLRKFNRYWMLEPDHAAFQDYDNQINLLVECGKPFAAGCAGSAPARGRRAAPSRQDGFQKGIKPSGRRLR